MPRKTNLSHEHSLRGLSDLQKGKKEAFQAATISPAPTRDEALLTFKSAVTAVRTEERKTTVLFLFKPSPYWADSRQRDLVAALEAAVESKAPQMVEWNPVNRQILTVRPAQSQERAGSRGISSKF